MMYEIVPCTSIGIIPGKVIKRALFTYKGEVLNNSVFNKPGLYSISAMKNGIYKQLSVYYGTVPDLDIHSLYMEEVHSDHPETDVDEKYHVEVLGIKYILKDNEENFLNSLYGPKLVNAGGHIYEYNILEDSPTRDMILVASYEDKIVLLNTNSRFNKIGVNVLGIEDPYQARFISGLALNAIRDHTIKPRPLKGEDVLIILKTNQRSNDGSRLT